MTQPQARPALTRALGKWDLTGVGINQVIGSGIFLLPATLAASVGGWSWVAVALVALVALLIALNFAEAGSRFDATGGAYLYTRAAFGRFVSFEVGWMLWVARATSWASVVNGLADALGYYWAGARAGGLRAGIILFVIGLITAINIRGIRQSATVVNALTLAKLAPLVIFIVLGLPAVSGGPLVPDTPLTWSAVSATALLLIFAFGGYETIPVPAGEATDPRRAVPFAMVTTIAVVAVVMVLVQIVALGTLPALSTSRTPLADAAALFIGGGGALLMTVGGTISMFGNNMGQALSGSRNLYALAEQGDLPPIFARVHPAFRTPDFAIVFTSTVSAVLAFSGSFATMAAASAVARLLVYAGTCASVLVLRRQGPAAFTIPGGPLVPVTALVISVAILYGATVTQLQSGGVALGIGAVLFAVARRNR